MISDNETLQGELAVILEETISKLHSAFVQDLPQTAVVGVLEEFLMSYLQAQGVELEEVGELDGFEAGLNDSGLVRH